MVYQKKQNIITIYNKCIIYYFLIITDTKILINMNRLIIVIMYIYTFVLLIFNIDFSIEVLYNLVQMLIIDNSLEIESSEFVYKINPFTEPAKASSSYQGGGTPNPQGGPEGPRPDPQGSSRSMESSTNDDDDNDNSTEYFPRLEGEELHYDIVRLNNQSCHYIHQIYDIQERGNEISENLKSNISDHIIECHDATINRDRDTSNMNIPYIDQRLVKDLEELIDNSTNS